MVKHIKRLGLSSTLGQNHNASVRNLPEAKVESMKDYTKTEYPWRKSRPHNPPRQNKRPQFRE